MLKQSINVMSYVMALVLALTVSPATGQIETNGSFENTPAGPVALDGIDGWVLEIGSSVSTPPDFEIADDMAHAGEKSLKIVVNSIGSNSWDVQAVGDSIPVVPGETFVFSVWAKSANAGAQANFTVGNYSFNEYGAIRPGTLTAEWQEFTFEFTITDQQTWARAPIHFSLAASNGATIYIDNLTIKEKEDVIEIPEDRSLAAGLDKFLGCAYSNAQATNFTNYWNQVTPENAGKWGSVEGTRDAMNWGGLDAAYNLAKSNGFVFRFHVLIWGNQQPAWIESLEPAEQLEEIEEWFAAVAERYPDIDYLEVVNEPLHDPPNQPGNGGGNYIEALGGSNGLYGTGWDWIIKAFELARQYFPDSTKLVINDYSIINSNSSTTDYLEIINLLMERDLIDGIGVQGHAFSTRSASESTMIANLDRLGGTGLPVQVCELDIDGLEDQVQLDEYRRVFPTLWEHPAVVGITLWGWRIGLWRTAQGANLIDERGAERPALEWLRRYLQGEIILPSRPTLISPDSAIDVPRDVLLLWNGSSAAESYRLQVATSSVFRTTVMDTTVTDTLVQLSPLEVNTTYYWRVAAANENGDSEFSNSATFTTGDHITSVTENSGLPAGFALHQNYPNPFNPTTRIEYSVPRSGHITLKVYSVLGQEVATLFEGEQVAGDYIVLFDGAGLAGGVYLYELKAKDFVQTRKLTLVK